MNLLISGATGFVSNSIRCNLDKNINSVKKLGLISSKINSKVLLDNLNISPELIDLQNFFNCKFNSFYDVYIHSMSAPRNSKTRYKLNLINLKKSLEVCLTKNIKTFVYLSSGAVYKKKESFFKEKDITVSSDEMQNTYAYAKLKEEDVVREFCQNNKINFIILRLFSFAGRLMMNRKEFAIIDLFNSAINNGILVVKNPKVIRSYMHEYDLGMAIISIISNIDAANKYINIGSPEPITMRELGYKISEITSANLVLENSDYKDFYVPNTDQQKKFYKKKLFSIDSIIHDFYSRI